MKRSVTKFVPVSMMVMMLLLGCKDFWHPEGPGTSVNPDPVNPTPDPGPPTKFEGTWTATNDSNREEKISFIFRGSTFTRMSVISGVQRYSTSGTFTYTDTSLTLTEPYDKYTYSYILTATILYLTRPPGSDYWHGQFSKQ